MGTTPLRSIQKSALETSDGIWGALRHSSLLRETWMDVFPTTRTVVFLPESRRTKKLQLTHWDQARPRAGSRRGCFGSIESLGEIRLVHSLTTRSGTPNRQESSLQRLEIWKKVVARWCHGLFPIDALRDICCSCSGRRRNKLAIPSKTTNEMVGSSWRSRGKVVFKRCINSSELQTQCTRIRVKQSWTTTRVVWSCRVAILDSSMPWSRRAAVWRNRLEPPS